jgi:hypothetical protein
MVSANDSSRAVARIKSLEGNQVRLLIKGWSPDVENELAAGDFDRIEFHGGEYENFAALVPHRKKISSIVIFNGTWRSAEGLTALSELRALTIGTRLPKDLDFRSLSQLRELNFDAWMPAYSKMVFDCENLEVLRIEGYDERDCSEIGRLSKLRRLSLAKGALQSLDGLAACSKLEAIELSHLRKFANLEEIEHLPALREVDLSDALPALRKFDVIRRKFELHRLSLRALSSDHADIEWLKQFTELRVLGIWNVVPADWDALFASKQLKKLAVTFTKATGLSTDQVAEIAKEHNLSPTKVVPVGIPAKTKGYMVECRPHGSTQNLWYWKDTEG